MRNTFHRTFTLQPLRNFGRCVQQPILPRSLERTFPEDANSPPHPLQLQKVLLVSSGVTQQLRAPELWTSLWPLEKPTIVTMPETAVDQNDSLVPR